MKRHFKKIFSTVLVTTLLLGGGAVYASELPQYMVRDGRIFTMELSADGKGTAEPDQAMGMRMARSSYKVLGSDVALYVDYSHGHGGDHFAAGWVRTTAPEFTARAEIWYKGTLDTTGPDTTNIGDIAEACSYLTVGIIPNATPRIFYNWNF